MRDAIEDDDALDRAVTHEAATRGPRPKLDGVPRAINLSEVRAQAKAEGYDLPGAEKAVSKQIQQPPVQIPLAPPTGINTQADALAYFAQIAQMNRGAYPVQPPNYGMPTHQMLVQPPQPAPYPPAMGAAPSHPHHLAEVIQRAQQEAFEQGRQYERQRLRAMLDQP